MITRAGYPTIANDVDEELLQATMPEIERRSWELVEMNNSSADDPKAQLIAELDALREKVAAL